MEALKRYFSIIVFTTFLLLEGVGGWYVWRTMEGVESSLPLEALALQRSHSGLIQNLSHLASTLNAVMVDPTSVRVVELSLSLDISRATFMNFRSVMGLDLPTDLRASMTEVDRILMELIEQQDSAPGLSQREALVFHTRLTDIVAALRHSYLRTNESAFAVLNLQVEQIEQLRISLMIALALIALSVGAIMIFIRQQRNTITILSETQRALQSAKVETDKINNAYLISNDLLLEANIKLKEMDKLKSMFIASMSHELRTPLNSVIGFSGLLLQGISGALNEKQTDSIERINRAGNHLLGLISDVIDISKIEAGRVDAFPEPFSLKEVVDDAVESIRPQADAKALKLEVTIDGMPDSGPDEWPEVVTDRKRLMQCLLNYLSNAVKFTEQGKITLTVSVNYERVEIAVTDTGIGIAEEDMPKLFEAFERLDTHLQIKAGGTGLGLYLTKKIAEEILHGSVSVESRVNEGTTFRLEIPINVSN